MQTYTLVHEDPAASGQTLEPAGFTGTAGPGIEQRNWPRSPDTGLPMRHAITLALPAEYQRQGPEFPGVSFFAGQGQFAEPDEAVASALRGEVTDPDDPFLTDLAATAPHPRFRLLTDLIEGKWGLLWLTADELAGRTDPPVDVRRPGEHDQDDQGTSAWDDAGEPEPTAPVWLVPRPDPNAGIAPDAPEYRDPMDLEDDPDWAAWVAEQNGNSHLGGTTFCVQATPEGLTPFYLELEQSVADLNFGGDGNAQIDLESDTFDWACG